MQVHMSTHERIDHQLHKLESSIELLKTVDRKRMCVGPVLALRGGHGWLGVHTCMDPAHRAKFQELDLELEQLDREIEEVSEPVLGRSLVCCRQGVVLIGLPSPFPSLATNQGTQKLRFAQQSLGWYDVQYSDAMRVLQDCTAVGAKPSMRQRLVALTPALARRNRAWRHLRARPPRPTRTRCLLTTLARGI